MIRLQKRNRLNYLILTLTIVTFAAVAGCENSLNIDDIFGTSPNGTVATPVITPDGGLFNTIQTIEISCTTEGAQVYYTEDGSVPTESSTSYSGAITISQAESRNNFV